MNKIIFCWSLCLAVGIGRVQAQFVQRKIYPQPRLTQAVVDIRQLRTTVSEAAEDAVQLPTSVDNSKTKYFPPILSQRGGSCAQASAIGYMLTYELNRLLDRDASASAENRMDYLFSWNMLNGGEDQGGFAEEGLYLAQRYGMMSEADYGGSAVSQFRWCTGYDKYLRAMQNRVERILVFDDSIPLLKRYLYDAGNGSRPGGILTFSTQSDGWKIDEQYKGPSATGYHSLLKKLATRGAHALTIVGYDDLVEYEDEKGRQHKGAFIVANTWGSWAHDHGRFYLPYDFFRDPSVSNRLLSGELQGVVPKRYQPKVVFKVRLSYDSRDDLKFSMAGIERGEGDAQPNYHYCYAFHNQGGDLPMQGKWLENSMEFAMDFTEFMSSPDAQYASFKLNVVKSAIGQKVGQGCLESVSVIDYRTQAPTEYVFQPKAPVELVGGDNVFTIEPFKTFDVSVSPYRYADEGKPSSKVFLLKTADGKAAKLKIEKTDAKNRKVTLKYKTE